MFFHIPYYSNALTFLGPGIWGILENPPIGNLELHYSVLLYKTSNPLLYLFVSCKTSLSIPPIFEVFKLTLYTAYRP